ncbi:MAG: threonine ammonia-lyase IlvA [Bacteroidota bacterium]|nr:threonine ammonia-lyase IlvA [Bacteroidota bacterium]
MIVPVPKIEEAYQRLKPIVKRTATERNLHLSELFNANIFLKREDEQIVRSYKIRGAYNNIVSRTAEELKNGIVCASAGNHAQGFALSCQLLQIKGHVFMPITTPKQKINQVKMFGKEMVEVKLEGDTYDDSFAKAIEFCNAGKMAFIHPFDNLDTIAGQGTIAIEILEDIEVPIDFIFLAIGGGGLASGVGSYFRQKSPNTKIIGVEPSGAPSMKSSLDANKVVTLEKIDKFVDGAAVKRVGDITFDICKEVLDDMMLVPEGKTCTTILQLYNTDGIVLEPAGSLTIAALDYYKDKIKGKNVLCLVSGSNNDIDRMNEIKERSLLFEGLKEYFIVNFPQRPGSLRSFLDDVLGPNDDIVRFEYLKKSSKDFGAALIGIEYKQASDCDPLTANMTKFGFTFIRLKENPVLFDYLV